MIRSCLKKQLGLNCITHPHGISTGIDQPGLKHVSKSRKIKITSQLLSDHSGN